MNVGRGSAHHTRRRLQWLARIWQIPESELPKKAHALNEEPTDFCEKYHISLDWLASGRDQVSASNARQAQDAIRPGTALNAKGGVSTEDFRAVIAQEVDRMLAERVRTMLHLSDPDRARSLNRHEPAPLHACRLKR